MAGALKSKRLSPSRPSDARPKPNRPAPVPYPWPHPSSISAVHEQSMHPLTLWYAGHASA